MGFDNILVVGPIAGKTHQELVFPVVAPDPAKDSQVKYLTYPLYAGGNRGRGKYIRLAKKVMLIYLLLFKQDKYLKLQ